NALNIRKPQTIFNAFPLSERNGRMTAAESRDERRAAGLSLYWYSQVIGPDRGLDDALEALAGAGDGVVLHVRGRWASGYENVFWRKADALGVRSRVHVLPC